MKKADSPRISLPISMMAALIIGALCLPETISGQQVQGLEATQNLPANLRGTTIQALVTLGLVRSGTTIEEASDIAEKIEIKQVKSLTDTLDAVHALPVRSGKARRTISIKILSHNLQENSGYTATAISPMLQSLADGAPVVADLARKSWRIREGTFSDESGKSRGNSDRDQLQRVLLFRDPKQNQIRCRLEDGAKGKTASISQAELGAALCSYAVVEVTAQKEESELESFPPDFKYDRTIIKPGHYAYLAVPYQAQAKGAICSAASALNVLHYIDPELNLEQREVLALFNGHSSMATQQQMVVGLRNLGYEAMLEQPREQEKLPLMAKVRTSLDEGRPMVVTTTKHALTLIGYNKSKGTLIYWDQALPKPGNPVGLPTGALEANEDSLRARMNYIIYVRKLNDGTAPSATEANLLVKLPGKADFLRHQVTNANPNQSFSVYLGHATVPKFRNLHQRGRSVLIPYQDQDTTFLEIIGEMDSKWIILAQPSAKEVKVTENRLIKAIEESNGVFFSRPVK